jgi:hypothetical protein
VIGGDERVDGGGEAADGGDEPSEALAPHLRALLLQTQPPLLQAKQLAVPTLPLLLAGHHGARQHGGAAHHAGPEPVQPPPLRLRLLVVVSRLRRPRNILACIMKSNRMHAAVSRNVLLQLSIPMRLLICRE